MGDLVCIFTGYRQLTSEIERKNYETATSRSGIFNYLEALNSLSSDASSLRKVQVIPGHFPRRSRITTTEIAPLSLITIPSDYNYGVKSCYDNIMLYR
jgi:hypothetical protein